MRANAEMLKAEMLKPETGLDGRWTVDSLWERRNQEQRKTIEFHPTECRALRALIAMHLAQKELAEAERMAPNGFCHAPACEVPVGPTTVFCQAHYPRALTRPRWEEQKFRKQKSKYEEAISVGVAAADGGQATGGDSGEAASGGRLPED